jgi:hypothetical protein
MEPEDELLTPSLEETPADYDQPDYDPASGDENPPESDDDGEFYSPDDTPDIDAPLDPSLLDDRALMAEVQRRQYLYQQQQGQGYADASYQQPHGVDPRLAQIVELSYTNPQMAEALRLQIAEERAEARVMQRIGPTLAPIAQREAIQNSGLSHQGQQYLSETFAQMPGVDVSALMSNPLTRDVLTRAARQYEIERTGRSAPRYESAASESPSLSADDLRAVRDFERMTGDKVDSDVIKSARRGL